MKKISIISISLLLAACSTSGDYVTEVTSDSFREEYKTEPVVEAIAANSMTESTMAQAPVQQAEPAMTQKQNMVRVTRTQPMQQQVQQQPRMVTPAASNNKTVRIIAPTRKQVESNKRYGFTIQVIAVDSSAKATNLAKKLPSDHPVWENYKQVNGTQWYTLLYGDYATRSEAKAAIQTLPQMFRDLKPFVKSLDEVKNSPYPKLIKLR